MKKYFMTIMMALALIMQAGVVQAAGERFVFISHAPDSDSWWNTIKNAINLASKEMDVTVEYRNPPSGDVADMARMVEQAVASNPQGIMVSIADFNVLQAPIAKATKKGIPVITYNSGTEEQSKKLGALLHVGQPEYDAGLAAGKRAKEAGAKHFLCVNHYITNPISVDRCKGFSDGLGVKLGEQMMDAGNDPTAMENKILAFLRAHPDTDSVFSLGPDPAQATIRALEQTKQAGKIYFGTFDLSPEIVAGIKSGTVSFAIDQQPFLQGYLPVVLLTNYVRYGVIPSSNIHSGPAFITKANVAQVEKLSGEYR